MEPTQLLPMLLQPSHASSQKTLGGIPHTLPTTSYRKITHHTSLCPCLSLPLKTLLHLRVRIRLSFPPLPPLPPHQIQSPHPRQLPINLLLLKRDLVRLFGGGPEARDVEAVVEVRAEVVHPADGEEDVDSELFSC